MANGIHKSEFKRRVGYLLLGIFGAYLAVPLRGWVDANFTVNPVLIGVVGFAVVLYFWEF